MFKSIFSKIIWTNFLILTVVLVAISSAFTYFVSGYIMDRQYEMSVKLSEAVNYWTGYLRVENNNIRSRSFYLNTLRGWADFLEADIAISDLDGNVVDTTNSDIKFIPSDYTEAIKNNTEIKLKGDFGEQYKGRVFTVGIPIEYYGNTIGGMYVNTPISHLLGMVSHLIVIFIIASIITILTVIFLIHKKTASITNSIKAINSAVLNIAAGNFNQRIPVKGSDELNQLASSFNFMADSLAKLDDMRSQFISDISHELRTPMTSISGFVEGILDGTIPPEKQNEYLKIVLDESNRLKKLVTDMLEMSKMSNSEYKLNVSTFDFTELIRICIIGLEQKITEKQLDLNVNFKEDDISVCADRDAIQRVVINLLDNAVKFSYPNTTINIEVWVENKKAYFSIGNFGVGIETSDLPHIFDRFYKTDKSRTNNSSGAGLGLSFVKNIMVLHKQRIWVESQPVKENNNLKYTKFTFTLELA